MKIIDRNTYLNKIFHHLGTNRIIILTGQRRVGKSYLLRSLRDRLTAMDGMNVIFIDKEKKEFDSILNHSDLNEYIETHRESEAKNIVLIDEIQEIEGFERTLRSYYEEKDMELVVTGSNSKMLSSELSTIIGGRYKEIYIQSLTYKEFLVFHQLTDSEESLSKYIRFGGLPGLQKIGLNDDDVLEYQSDVLNTVLVKDMLLRHEVRNVTCIQNLLHYLADNTGKLISASNISKHIGVNSTPVSTGAVLNYLGYIRESYITKNVPRYDIYGKRLFESNEKYYFQDIGIRNSLIRGVRMFDIEKVIENIVYNQLIFRGYEVWVGQLRNKEIDFVAKRPGREPNYIQVANLIAGDDTYQREFGNLKEIKDNYPKFVISMSPLLDEINHAGIRHISLRRFLTDDDSLASIH